MVLFMEWLIYNDYKKSSDKSKVNLDLYRHADVLLKLSDERLRVEKGIINSPGQIVETDIQTVDALIEKSIKN